MFIIQTYSTAIIFCVITMLCWGSWANTQKLALKTWRFELFYWDYTIGILIFSILSAFTLGSYGTNGRSFINDISQANISHVGSAMLGGVIFNAANILLVAAISIAGMSVAFPVGIGIALVLGVIVNYYDKPDGNSAFLFAGVGLIIIAIILNAVAYRKMSSGNQTTIKGLLLSAIAGILMGFFYKFVSQSMFLNFNVPENGKLSPYTAVVFFSVGIFLSNFIFNTMVMRRPFIGSPVLMSDYFKGSIKNHFTGILGGVIWCLGMSFNIIASGKTSPAIAYGLGQGATVVAAIWGIFVWKEFNNASKATTLIIALMLAFYIAGLAMIIITKI